VSIPFLPGIHDISQDLKNKLQVEQSKEGLKLSSKNEQEIG
jgi:hypothetical protein